MSKDLSVLEQTLVDTINKASVVGGEIYDGAKAVTEKSVDFAMQQIPDVVHQLLLWNMTSAIIWCLVSVIIIIISLIITKKCWESTGGEICILTAFPIGILTAVFLYNLMKAVKIYIAPKLYLLEYVANLVK